MTYTSRSVDPSSVLPLMSTLHIYRGICGDGLPASSVWPSANRAIYVPHVVLSPTWVRRLWFAGGNTTGNVDVGIYRQDGSRIVSTGAIANANALVFTDVTDILLPPGAYWIAASQSSTGQVYRSATAFASRGQGVCEEESAHPLPATMTPVVSSVDYVPIVGYSTIAAEL